jgi:hypothetical protein
VKINIYPTDPSFGGDYMKFCIRKASENLPEWYKQSNSYHGDENDKRLLNRRMTMKKCMPIFDYLTNGVHLYLPFTFFVYGKYPERIVDADTSSEYCKIGMHTPEQVQKFPLPDSYDQTARKIDFPYLIETPKGYSSVYVQPTNEYSDSLFFPRALVSTDNYKNQVNFPFFIKKDFEGEVPAGTHFMSILFVKREELELSYMDYKDGSDKIMQARAMTQNWVKHFYKNIRFN